MADLDGSVPVNKDIRRKRNTRSKPRRYRNPLCDVLWMRAVVRSRAANLGHLDLDHAFYETLREDPVNPVSIEIVVAGKGRSHRLPSAVPGNASAASQHVDHLSQIGEVIPATAERALCVLAAIEGVSPPHSGNTNTPTPLSVPRLS